ncbi:alpha/beta hydrolase [Vagococcus elongatus]|uniref:Alpha/beta hydrolase n=1 Tax=Vagococcus elongatus TaxID=180344 RepID=A0A430AMS4_9ENTE|nr:alpha/beta hydrolase [Vagococcus elongatus]RSU09263.1 hypothetical protein CBF29_11790 [Vagococcus elongatus]
MGKGNKWEKIFFAAGFCLAGAGVYRVVKNHRQAKQLALELKRERLTPTLMLHGIHGDKRTMQGMIRRWRLAGLAYKALEIQITKDGEMIIDGLWIKNDEGCHPIIQVFFENNDATPVLQVSWLLKIMTFLNKELGIDEINLLGHSMGGVAVLGYLTQATKYKDMTPKVEKFIALGSPFKGELVDSLLSQVYQLEKDGKRNFDRYYDFFMAERAGIPKDLRVLNVYGDLNNGSESDGIVATKNAAILKDMLGDSVSFYAEHVIKGLGGQHTLLHENAEVDQLVAKFLWQEESEF